MERDGGSMRQSDDGIAACLDQCEQSSGASESLDRLQEWMQSGHDDVELEALNDTRLLSILWHHLSSDRKVITTKAKACLQDTLAFMETLGSAASTSTKGRKRAAKGRRSPPSPEPGLLASLVKRTTAYMERRASLTVMEVLQSRYGIEFLLARQDELYGRLLQTSLDTADASKRAKLCLSVLEYQGNQLGVFAKEEKVGPTLVQARRTWCNLWISKMGEEMRDEDEKRIHLLCAYHLPPLLQQAPWSLAPLVDTLCRSSATMTLLAVLQCAKVLELCRVGDGCNGPEDILLGDESALTYSNLTIVIPPTIMEPFLTSSSAQAQSAALSILVESKSLTSQVSEEELRLTRLLITSNFSQSNPDLRQTTLVKLSKLIHRLKALTHVANHALIKGRQRSLDNLSELEANRDDVFQRAKSFLLWLFHKACHATHPGAPYHLTRTGINLLDLLLVCGVDTNYTAEDRKMGRGRASLPSAHSWPFSLALVSPWLVNRLLECHGSTYFDIQQTAREMLLCLPSPLPSHDQRGLADSMLQRARSLMLSPREFQSEAGASLSSLYLELYIKRLDWSWTPLSTTRQSTKADFSNRHLLFIHHHLAFLHDHLDAAQHDSRLASARNFPLHGTLVTLQRLVSSLDLAEAPVFEVQRLVEDILAVVDRTWQVTKDVLCHSAPEGSEAGEVDHEIARALEGVGLEEERERDGGWEFSSTPRYQILLSYAWRGMKEASALLGAVVAKTLSLGPEISQSIWTAEELEGVGSRFNDWMSLVRHRGAYSTIYPAYSAASSAINASLWAPIDQLPASWLSHFLTLVASPQAAISTTRRSAGIGYAVLALLCSFSRSSLAPILSSTMAKLIDIVQSSPSQQCQIHALNILRVIVADGSLSESLESFIGPLFILAIPRFTSPSWHIRNAVMMLFSELTIRAFGNSINRDGSQTKTDWHDFFARFPGLDAVLYDGLEEEAICSALDHHQSSLFAVLLVLSKLQVFTEDGERVEERTSAAAFAQRIDRCLQSHIWKIREVAAASMAATTAPADAARACEELMGRCNVDDANGTHGRLMAVQCTLLRFLYPQLSSSPPRLTRQSVSSLLALSHGLWQRPGQSRAGQIACIEIAILLKSISPLTSLEQQYHSCLAVVQANQSGEEKTALEGQLMGACARVIVREKDGNLAWMINSGSKAVRREALVYLIEAADKSAFACHYPAILQVLVDEGEQATTRIKAAELLNQVPCSLTGDQLLQGWVGIAQIALNRSNVSFRDHCLPCLSRMVVSLYKESKTPVERYGDSLDLLLQAIYSASNANESIESRLAAVRSLQGLKPLLFPEQSTWLDSSALSGSLFHARLALFDMAVDDDEEIRIEAANVVRGSIWQGEWKGERRGDNATLDRILCVAGNMAGSSTASVDALWSWMDAFYSSLQSSQWHDHVWSRLMDGGSPDSSRDDAALFAEERANQYIDEMDGLQRSYEHCRGAQLAAKALPSGLALTTGLQRLSLDARNLVARQDGSQSTPGSWALSSSYVELQRLDFALSAVLDHPRLPSIPDAVVADAGNARASLQDLLDAMPTNAEGQEQRGSDGGGKGDRLCIAMVSDFFFPNVGGVEGHIYMLSQRLIERGHKVIVVTHAYGPDRVGIRHLTAGLKVYHVPYRVIARQDTLPNFFSLMPILRSIYIREGVNLVHGHQALSSMGLEAILHARTMHIKTVFTDHSLFGFNDTASILTNKLLTFFLADVDNVICVSHTGKENTVLRAGLADPSKVYVIPNAIVAEHFRPTEGGDGGTGGRRIDGKINIVVLSRLMYRKGIDLLIAAIPRLCALHPNVHFIIGGEGPKRVELEQMRERHALHSRVEMCGRVRQAEVKKHLNRGEIFLNTSLTEAFGTGIIEAASCGLFVVSTKVGGIPEVLPPQMTRLALPEEDDIVRVTQGAIEHVQSGNHNPLTYHQAVAQMYSWSDTARRVELVYRDALHQPFPSLVVRLEKYRTGGPVAGLIFCIIAVVDVLFLHLLDILIPSDSIDVLP